MLVYYSKLTFIITLFFNFSFAQSVAERYGDRIELLGVPIKDPLVLGQILIAIFLSIVFIQSSLDKMICRKDNLEFFKSHFSRSIFRKYYPFLLSILTILELVGGLMLVYGIYYSFTEKVTLWIFYGFVHIAFTIIFLLLGQRIAKDYKGAADLVPYFILIILGIMSMY